MDFEVSETLFKVKKRDREANWTKEEELLLLEEVGKKLGVLFGSFSGPSGSGMSKQSKQAAWEEIANVLNSRSTSSRRNVDQLKKKHANLKQIAKAKVSELKHPKTGGGPPIIPSPAVQVMIEQLEGTPGLEGIVGGIDTSDIVAIDMGFVEDESLLNTEMEVSDLPLSIHGNTTTTKRKKNVLTEEILHLEKEKIKEEIKLMKDKQILTKMQTELIKLQILQIDPSNKFDF